MRLVIFGFFAKVFSGDVPMDGSRIAQMRNELQYSQQELADLAGVSMHTVFRAEKGNSATQMDSLKAIARALNTSVAYLIGEIDDPTLLTPSEARAYVLKRIREGKEAGNEYPDFTEEELKKFIPDDGLGVSGSPRPTLLESTPTDRIPPENIRSAGEMITLPVFDIQACAGRGASLLFADVEKIGERTIERKLIGVVSSFDERKPFIVKVDGDSMSEAGIRDGDEVVVNPAMDVYNGDVAMVSYGPNRSTALKWVYNLPNGAIELRSATPGFPIFTYTTEQQESDSGVEIIGKVMVYTGQPKRG